MKTMRHLLIFFGALLVLASCSKDEPAATPTPSSAERTVVVYMSGENDINSFVQGDIDEMIAGRRLVSSNVQLVLFVDLAGKTPFLARVTTDTRQPLDTLYKYEQDFYATDPDAMRDVLERATTLCPATRDYGLVLWGHAAGWTIENDSVATSRRAYGRDSGDNTASATKGKWLNMPSLRKALSMTGKHWKFIFCDCCNMQSVEVAYELRGATDYLIASPAEITGKGAPYDTMVKDFFLTDDAAMCSMICDDYYAQTTHEMGRGDEHLPISAIATSQLPALASATRQILPAVDSYLRTTANATDALVYYSSYRIDPTMRYSAKEKIMFDMLNVVRTALADQPEQYQTWLAAFDRAVPYRLTSGLWHANWIISFSHFSVTPDNSGCVSMFFPLERYADAPNKYNENIRKLAWYYAVGWSDVGW